MIKYLFATLFYLLGTLLLGRVMKGPSAKAWADGKVLPIRWGESRPWAFYLGVLMFLVEFIVLMKQ